MNEDSGKGGGASHLSREIVLPVHQSDPLAVCLCSPSDHCVELIKAACASAASHHVRCMLSNSLARVFFILFFSSTRPLLL